MLVRSSFLLLVTLSLAACSGTSLGVPDAAPPDAASPDAASPDAARPDAARLDAAPDAGPDLCEGVPATACDGDVLRTCTGGVHGEQDCAAGGQRCLWTGADGARCGPAPADCSDLPEGDVCVADHLIYCVSDQLREWSCGALGGRCRSDGVRAGCLGAAAGARRVTGRITIDHREPGPDGLGPVTIAPAAHVTVVARRASDDLALGMGIADAAGRYDVAYAGPAGAGGVYVEAQALRLDPRHRFRVRDDAGDGYAVASAAADDTAGDVTLDLHVDQSEGAGALHILGVLVADGEVAQAWVGRRLPALQVFWERGLQTFDCGTCFSPWGQVIFLLGLPEDTDEYDAAVISHEYGHYLAWAASRDDTPGGAHDGTPTDSRLAWSEGLATFLSLHLLGQDVYVDTRETGTLVRDPEQFQEQADPTGGLAQDVSEFLVLGLLWDVVDPVSGPEDPMARPVTDVIAVLTGYLPSSALENRGRWGVDLVDFLDGWLCQGLGDAAGLGTLLDGVSFPYDFAGPAAPCLKPESAARVTVAPSPARLAVTIDLHAAIRSGAVRLVDRGRGGALERVLLGPAPAGARVVVTLARPAGRALEDLVVGVDLDRGPGVQDHVSVAGARAAIPAGPVRRYRLPTGQGVRQAGSGITPAPRPDPRTP
jgi:hypothetical protein